MLYFSITHTAILKIDFSCLNKYPIYVFLMKSYFHKWHMLMVDLSVLPLFLEHIEGLASLTANCSFL